MECLLDGYFDYPHGMFDLSCLHFRLPFSASQNAGQYFMLHELLLFAMRTAEASIASILPHER